jgi:hypothetical protein
MNMRAITLPWSGTRKGPLQRGCHKAKLQMRENILTVFVGKTLNRYCSCCNPDSCRLYFSVLGGGSDHSSAFVMAKCTMTDEI